MKRVVAIIVTYNPNIDALFRLLKSIQDDVFHTIIIDNASHHHILDAIAERADTSCRTTLLRLDANLGIAAAQNLGIRKSRALGADYVILFDQDSLPAGEMIQNLLKIAVRLAKARKIAAIGPRYTDKRQANPPPFIRIEGLSLKRQLCKSDIDCVEVDYLIASGSLIPISTLDEVGLMREDLFIDYVDIEWGLRAKNMGFQSYGACGAMMEHDLGDSPINFLGRRIPLHSPLRHYYHFRNAVRLYCEGDMDWNWKAVDAWRLLLKYGFYSLFAKPRRTHFSMMTLGIIHGIIGRMGKLDD